MIILYSTTIIRESGEALESCTASAHSRRPHPDQIYVYTSLSLYIYIYTYIHGIITNNNNNSNNDNTISMSCIITSILIVSISIITCSSKVCERSKALFVCSGPDYECADFLHRCLNDGIIVLALKSKALIGSPTYLILSGDVLLSEANRLLIKTCHTKY